MTVLDDYIEQLIPGFKTLPLDEQQKRLSQEPLASFKHQFESDPKRFFDWWDLLRLYLRPNKVSEFRSNRLFRDVNQDITDVQAMRVSVFLADLYGSLITYDWIAAPEALQPETLVPVLLLTPFYGQLKLPDMIKLNLDDFDSYAKQLKNILISQPFMAELSWNHQFQSVSSKQSYSFLLKKSKSSTTFFDEIADTHLFFQLSGLIPQNDDYVKYILDGYNTFRFKSEVKEAKNVFYALLKPLYWLCYEYTQIAKRETNSINIVLRGLMPLLVMGLFVFFVGVLLTPFSVPELFLLLLLVPTVYVGLVLASAFVWLKNQVYDVCHMLWYGDCHTKRMIKAFNGLENAQAVRDFYKESINDCDARERYLSSKKMMGMASVSEHSELEALATRKLTLLAEWYDIHRNFELGFDVLSSLVAHRLDEDARMFKQKFKQVGDDYIDAFVCGLKEQSLGTALVLDEVQEKKSLVFSCQQQFFKCAKLSKQLNNGLYESKENYPPLYCMP